MNLLFLFQQPDDTTAPAADTATKAGVGVFEKIGGTIGLVFCIVLLLGAAAMLVVQGTGMFTRRMADKESERQWERENAIPVSGEEKSMLASGAGRNFFNGAFKSLFGVGSLLIGIGVGVALAVMYMSQPAPPVTDANGNITQSGHQPFVLIGMLIVGPGVIAPLVALFLNFLRAPFGWDSWGEFMKTFVAWIGGELVFWGLAVVLAIPAGLFLGQADAVKAAAENAAKAAGLQDPSVPASYTVYTLLGGVFLGATMLVPVLTAVAALKKMFKNAADKDAIVLDIDPGTRSTLWSEWLRDKIWVERKQSKHFTAMLMPALIVYGVMVAGTLIVYAVLCIFFPGARDVGFPFSAGGPYWLLLLIPPMVCAPPFLPLFASLLLGVPMRRKIKESGTVAS
jgi:hypothetical protein